MAEAVGIDDFCGLGAFAGAWGPNKNHVEGWVGQAGVREKEGGFCVGGGRAEEVDREGDDR